jgi:hypothetical protein
VRRHEPEVAPIIAPLPESLQQRCSAAPGLLAQLIVSKILRSFATLLPGTDLPAPNYQVWLPRQSMARWVQLASEWLKPIYRQIKDQMMRGPYIQVDETPIRYLDPGHPGQAGTVSRMLGLTRCVGFTKPLILHPRSRPDPDPDQLSLRHLRKITPASNCRHSVTCCACRSKPNLIISGLAFASPPLAWFSLSFFIEPTV